MLADDDRIRLQHILDAARRAVRFADTRSRSDLESDEDPLADALVRLISVVGEAASRLSSDTRSQLDAIPWADVIGMRNRLIHGYFDINLDILWATVEDSLPSLIRALELALVADSEV